MFRFLIILLCLLAPVHGASQQVPTSKAQISLSFAPLVKKASPAVVNIYARRVVAARRSPFANDPVFGNFFRDFAQTRPQVQNSLGSGVILSDDGIVVSNYHVVGQATDIRVVLNDRREFSARVILGDEESDLAILQIDDPGESMPFLVLRDSSTVEVGELVLAIGNPFGVGQTVTTGIVSGLARSGTATGNARGYFLQTDAAINPGNSGGALIDTNGDLVGINTSILTRSGASNGIGFAIPAALVAQFLKQAKAGKTEFERPWAGITGQPVDSDLAETFGLSVPGGMVITGLHPSSPFVRAGFKAGDIITAVDGHPVNTPPEALFHMSVAGIGGRAMFTRLRDGDIDAVAVQLIPPPETPPREARELGGRDLLPGLRVANINPAVIAELNLPLRQSGVVVMTPGPNGARVGLSRGDIILAIDRQEVHQTKDVIDLLNRTARQVEMVVQRGSRRVALRFRT